jgi:hypothetical protein
MAIKFRKDTRANLAAATPDDETIIILTDSGNRGLAIGTGAQGGQVLGDVTTTGAQTLTNKTIGAATLSGVLDGDGNEVARNITRVVTGVSGTLTIGDHSGCLLVTSGNVTVPTTTGFHAVIVAGGAHTVTFNSTVSPAMVSGDVMTVFVQSATVIQAVLTAAANKVAFT